VSIETELKLHISPEHLQRLRRHPFLRSLTSDRARTQKLTSIYYDTPDLALRRHAMALRLRNVGKQWIQTLKGGGQVSAGLHQRNEFEAPVPSEQLDFDVLKDCGGTLPHGARQRLRPVFITDFSRNIRLVEYAGAKIELCIDSGEIRAGHQSCPISEVELELKSGEPRQLFKLAMALLDIVPMRVEHTSKAEYGYRLFSASKPTVRKGGLSPLHKDQSVSAAMRSLIADCLSHVQSNVPGVLLRSDAEYLHQVRVGLRRLRVVLAIALRSRPDVELASLRQQVSELCVGMGRSREWDVFVTQTLKPICARLSEHEGLREIARASERARKKQHAGVEDELGSVDFQRMLLRFGAWMHSEQLDVSPISLKVFISKSLKKRVKDVVNCRVALQAGDVDRLHRLRIACKKLRYCIEMFDSLFDREKSKVYMGVLADLQDVLGRFNDHAVAHRLADTLDSKARHEVIALIHEYLEQDVEELDAEFSKAWKRFAKLKTCWE
jgi:inorganic triphosphatase YgiF